MNIIKQRVDINSLVDWRGLSVSLDYIDTLILKFVYWPRQQTWTFNEIMDHLNRGKIDPLISRESLRKKINFLEKENLLRIVKTKPLIIWPLIELSEANIKQLLKNLSILHRLERIE